MILKSYLHIKTRHLVKILLTTPTYFSLSRPSSGSFVLPYFEVSSATMLTIYGIGRTPAKEHTYNINSHTHAAVVPYIVSIVTLATSK